MSTAAPGMGIHRLEGRMHHYAWGSTDAIARLREVPRSGRPEAELWFGAHPSAPSFVDGRALDAVLSDDPGLVGAASVGRFGPRLPYLLKLLAAAQPLSLQAHPSRQQAEQGYAREEAAGVPRDAPERNYKDDWPKPEMLVALAPTEALCGFRPAAETAALLARFAMPDLDDLATPLRGHDDAAGIRQVFLDCLRLAPSAAAGIVQRLVERAGTVEADDEYGRLCRTAVELNRHYPGDRGVLAALLMNRMTLQRYEGVYLPAGNLHAYLHGFGVEIMANSDNVLRGGLTAKHVDVSELARLLDFSPAVPVPVPVEPETAGLLRYRTPAPEFALWRIDGPAPVDAPAHDTGRIVLAVGPTTVSDTTPDEPAASIDLAPGDAAFLPAGRVVRVRTDGGAFVAAPGVG